MCARNTTAGEECPVVYLLNIFRDVDVLLLLAGSSMKTVHCSSESASTASAV